MGSAIVERTVLSETTRRITLTGAQICRPVTILPTWTRLRLGLRMSIAATAGGFGDSELFIGLVSDPTHAWADTYCQHAMGVYFYTFATTDIVTGITIGNGYFVKRVGHITTTLNAAQVIYGSAAAAISRTDATPRNSCMAFEFFKKPGDIYSLHATGGRSGSSGTYASKTSARFFGAQNLPGFLDVSDAWSTAITYDHDAASGAVNESTDGSFTSVCVYWKNPTYPLEIDDIAVTRME